MADSKRNSVAGKVATPKTAGTPTTQPVPDALEAVGKAIGARIKVTTAAPHSKTYDGTVYTADPVTNLIIVNTRAATANPSTDVNTQQGDYHVISISQIQSFQIVSLASGTDSSESSIENAKPSITAVDVKRLKQRCDDRMRELKEQEQHRGKGVSKEAQAIFDSFRRINMPIRWHNQEMIVHDAIIIAAPYRPEDCKGAGGKQEVLNRVKTVLQGERKKIKEREDRDRKAATPTGPRKGG